MSNFDSAFLTCRESHDVLDIATSLGFKDSSRSVRWNESIAEVLGVNCGVCLAADFTGGVAGALSDFTLVFYDKYFNKIDDATGLINEETLYIAVKERNQLIFLNKQKTGDNSLYFVADLTKYMEQTEKLLWTRDHDALTGLLNHACFLRKSRGALLRGAYSAVVFMDLDNLKQMNDNWGHKCGDDYILTLVDETNSLLSNIPCEEKLFARISGDEFALCLAGFKDAASRSDSLSALKKQTSNFTLPNGSVVKLSRTAGVALCPDDSQSISELLLYSEFAMTEAKKFEKGGVGFFSRQKYNAFLDISGSGDKFDELLKKKAISFVYVPYVDSASGDVSVFEMFPVGHVAGLEDINSIKAAAKYFHRLIELDRMIYEALKEEFKKLAGLSFSQVITLGYMPQDIFYSNGLEDMLGYTKYPSNRLCLCFGSDMRSENDKARGISTAKGLGIRFGFKEFSSKSSETALAFRPHIVKLSKGLSRGCSRDEAKKRIVKNLIEYAKMMEFGMSAGYIESEEDLAFLRKIGINLLGGDAVFGSITISEIEDYSLKNRFQGNSSR